MFFWVGVHVYVCFGLECMRDIRLESLYAKIPVSLLQVNNLLLQKCNR